MVRCDFYFLNPENNFREQVGGTHLATEGGTVAILAQGTSWAVAVTQAFWAAVQIPLVWVLGIFPKFGAPSFPLFGLLKS